MRQLTPATPGRSLMTKVFVDANAAIDYIRECTLHDLGMSPTSRRANALRIRLGQIPRVFVAETAGREARHNLKKDLVRHLGYSRAVKVERYAQKLLDEYLDSAKHEDLIEHVPAARAMYAGIRAKAGHKKLAEWESKKGAFVRDPVLGSDINDLKILSTAAHYARQRRVDLWTRDMDFTMFDAEIYATFGVRIVDTYRLGG